ncbi:hypothetical protein C8R21_11025 [Nitrosospira multiformis]|uniref:Uncharacterized protein n=1 Tax=Nitrosospira multiformis TaxID=1231 RepID=A0A2T5IBU8_9PROT|nr:hypothetical protein C8R21_11025 [Nitrosospira multiformis]
MAKAVCSARKRRAAKGVRKRRLANGRRPRNPRIPSKYMRSHSRNLPDALSIVLKYRDPPGK